MPPVQLDDWTDDTVDTDEEEGIFSIYEAVNKLKQGQQIFNIGVTNGHYSIKALGEMYNYFDEIISINKL